MNRKIKFRAWDLKEKLMGPVMDLNNIEGLTTKDENDFVWLQYTGLKDKKGVEIYEGDILSIPLGKDSPKYETVSHCIEEVKWTGTGWKINDHGSNYDVEIIGNIYENKDLLQ